MLSGNVFKICAWPFVLRFLYKIFSKLLKFMLWNTFQINNVYGYKLVRLWSNLSWKDAASNTEGIIRNCKLFMSFNEWEQVLKEIKKKEWMFALSITYLNEWTHFPRQFLLLVWPLFVSLFFFSSVCIYVF